MELIKDWLPLISIVLSIPALIMSTFNFFSNRRRDKEERHLEIVRKTAESIHALEASHLALMGNYERCRALELIIDLKTPSPLKEEFKGLVKSLGNSILKDLSTTRELIAKARASQKVITGNYGAKVLPVPHGLRVMIEESLSLSKMGREFNDSTSSDLDRLYELIQKEEQERKENP
jgi:hypothetical protein